MQMPGLIWSYLGLPLTQSTSSSSELVHHHQSDIMMLEGAASRGSNNQGTCNRGTSGNWSQSDHLTYFTFCLFSSLTSLANKNFFFNFLNELKSSSNG